MEAAGGEAAAHWRAAGQSQEAWLTYCRAEEAYWDTQAWAHCQRQTVAILRMAETTLRKTALTPAHRQHGWSERLTELLASMCAECRAQVETDTFTDAQAGYDIARTKMEEVSPKWPDLDDLSVAVDLARRALDIASHRLGLENDAGR
jgi:hypothetical protein